jgi:pSer/pThr/pTyr-binding forkhead associated (FHA) protein
VQRGSNAGSRFLLDTDHSTVGRHPDSDIFLDDISVSRRHATFERTPRGTVVRDAGSLNGTYVNRELVDECLLQAGDEVQIGKFRLVFHGSARA